jgi:hypothetical protein
MYWSRDFETVEAQKACTKQGAGIATRVTKSGAGVHADRGKAEDRKLSEIAQSWGGKVVEVEGETAMDLYLTLRPRLTR